MTMYARLNVGGNIERLIDLTADQYTALQANGKATWLRLWVVDAKPAPSATQVVIDAGIIITATEAHQTWGLRDKTQAELDVDTNALELPTVVAYVDQWTTDIQAYTTNIDTSGTIAVQAANMWVHIKDLQRMVLRNNRALRFLARERRL